MSGQTKFKRVQETDLETGLTAVAIQGRDVDGKTVEVTFGDPVLGFLPLAGGEMTGDIEFDGNVYGLGLKQTASADPVETKLLFNQDEGIKIESTVYDNLVDRNIVSRSSVSNSPQGIYFNTNTDGYSAEMNFSQQSLRLQFDNPLSKGIVGTTFFDKQNDPLAYAQLSDLSNLSILATGLAEGGLLTVNTDTAKFNQAAGFGYIRNGSTDVENSTLTKVTWAEQLAITVPNLATQEQTFVARDITGALFYSPNPFTATQRRSYMPIGVLVHLNNTSINYIDFNPSVAIEIGAQVQDILAFIKFKSLSGNRIFPFSTNLKIKKEAGRVFKPGANFGNLTTQPHSFDLPAQDPITFRYRTQTGVEGSDVTDINPAIYDVNGTITAMPATATLATIQRIYIFQDGIIRIQPGQRFFNNLNEAVTAINSDIFTTDSDIFNNGLYLGAIVLIRGTTNLSLLAQAIFVPSSGTCDNGSIPAGVGFVPTSGTDAGVPMDGLYETTNATRFFKNLGTTKSGFEFSVNGIGGTGLFFENTAGSIYNTMRLRQGDVLIQSNEPSFGGILGATYFNKVSNGYAFAQLQDVAIINTTTTALSLATLNSTYPTASYGVKIICKSINKIYVKDATGWEAISTTTVV
jgi:hypothetical protein